MSAQNENKTNTIKRRERAEMSNAEYIEIVIEHRN